MQVRVDEGKRYDLYITLTSGVKKKYYNTTLTAEDQFGKTFKVSADQITKYESDENKEATLCIYPMQLAEVAIVEV